MELFNRIQPPKSNWHRNTPKRSIQSTEMPAYRPTTFNEWQQHLQIQADKIMATNVHDKLIDQELGI